jgi:U3 small nucleolar RNA-associated protein 10
VFDDRRISCAALTCASTWSRTLGPHILAHLPAQVKASMAVFCGVLATPSAAAAATKKSKKSSSKKRKRSGDSDADDASTPPVVPALTVMDCTVMIHVLRVLKSNLQSMQQFMSPYMFDVLQALLHPVLLSLTSTAGKKKLGAASDGEDEALRVRTQSRRLKLAAELSLTLQALARRIEPRLLIPVIMTSYRLNALPSGDAAVVTLLHFMKTIVDNMKKPQVAQYHAQIAQFCLAVFGIRESVWRNASVTQNIVQVDKVELATLELYMSIVLKLTEGQLKGVFLKTMHWVGIAPTQLKLGLKQKKSVAADDSDSSGSDSESKTSKSKSSSSEQADVVDENISRCVTFARVILIMSTRLKMYFVPYVGYLLDHFLLFLQPCVRKRALALSFAADNEQQLQKKRKVVQTPLASAADAHKHSFVGSLANLFRLRFQLSQCVVQTLTHSFTNDSVAFWGKLQFDKLVPLLVSQLASSFRLVTLAATHTSNDGNIQHQYRTHVEQILGPCFVQLAARMGDYNLWKPLNHGIWIHTQRSMAHSKALSHRTSQGSDVRWGAVKCIQQLFEGLGDQYLVLLPETVPFIHEAMEDEDAEVEQEVHTLIKLIESLSGEDLMEHLQR